MLVELLDLYLHQLAPHAAVRPCVGAEVQARSSSLIGVHTPEFAFEHDIDNVRRAVRQLRIDYPVVIDNDYAIWRAFGNQYWPALYLIDARGTGSRIITSARASTSSPRRSSSVCSRKPAPPAATRASCRSMRLASKRRRTGPTCSHRRTTSGTSGRRTSHRGKGWSADRRRLYAAPARLALNQWALAGDWTMGRQATVANSPNGRIVYRFHARDLHLVMGPPRQGASVRFRVTIDGQPPGAAHGGDVDEGGNGTVVEQRLYQLIRQPKPIVDRQFEIEFLDAGVEAFAFTFG